jgi:hypothetical protein
MYGIQFAFYQQILLRSIFDEYDIECAIPAKVYVIAVEKREPFRCGVFEVSGIMLANFTGKVRASIAMLKECQRDGEYPTLYESMRTLNIG